MSQRISGYARKERECYETPEWVTDALIPHIPVGIETIWEPACGSGKIVNALAKRFAPIYASDLPRDFLRDEIIEADAIITNPPYNLAAEFIERAISICDWVAMLLRTDFDHAKTRARLFDWPFAKKIVLRKRIVWFERPGAAPSFNHAWFIWDKQHEGAPTLAYAA